GRLGGGLPDLLPHGAELVRHVADALLEPRALLGELLLLAPLELLDLAIERLTRRARGDELFLHLADPRLVARARLGETGDERLEGARLLGERLLGLLHHVARDAEARRHRERARRS